MNADWKIFMFILIKWHSGSLWCNFFSPIVERDDPSVATCARRRKKSLESVRTSDFIITSRGRIDFKQINVTGEMHTQGEGEGDSITQKKRTANLPAQKCLVLSLFLWAGY